MNFRIYNITECPDEDFYPSTTITFLSSLYADENSSIMKDKVLNLIEHFIEVGCDLDKTDHNYYAPIHIAIIGKQAELVRVFVLNGADKRRKIKGTGPSAGLSPLELARKMCGSVDENCQSV